MSNLSKKEVPDILRNVEEKREALRVFRFEGAGSRTRNVREGRTLRKEIARMLTEVRSRTLPKKIAKTSKNA